MKKCQNRIRALLLAGSAIIAFSLPLNLVSSGGSWKIQLPSALAKDGGNGGGNGNGNGGGNGNTGGNGNGNNGSDGNSGNNSSGASANGKSNSAKSSLTPNNTTTSAVPAAPQASDNTDDPATTSPLNVRHSNGFTETLAKGAYVMKDSKGRVVVDRRARPEDVRRLKSLDR